MARAQISTDMAQLETGAASAKPTITQRGRGASEGPVVDARLQVKAFGSQLGDISALAMDDTGIIYAADQRLGRIYKLSDRALDGRLDASRTLVSGLDMPSGLAVIGERLFIADKRAIWEVPLEGGVARQFVDLNHSQALESPRLLAHSKNGQHLIIALSEPAPSRAGKIITISIETKEAKLASQGPGPITALAVGQKDSIWVGVNNAVLPIRNATYDLDAATPFGLGAVITGLALPGQFTTAPGALSPWKDHIMLSQGGTARPQSGVFGGQNILAVPTLLGQTSEGAEVFVNGFAGKSGRSAWGQPGPILIDSRGLFFADRWSRTLWLVEKAALIKSEPELKAVPSDETIEILSPALVPKAELNPKGSSIKVGSKIEFGTSITTGSSIPKGETRTESKDAPQMDQKPPE